MALTGNVTNRVEHSGSGVPQALPRIAQTTPKAGTSFETSLTRLEARSVTAIPVDSRSELSAARQRAVEELRAIIRAIDLGETDPEQLTDLIFYARHPEMLESGLTPEVQELVDEWNTISAKFVQPVLNDSWAAIESDQYFAGVGNGKSINASTGPAGERFIAGAATRFDDLIARAAEWFPGLPPSLLKGLLAQESGLNASVINEYGYAGIAQIGREEAREAGLQVGIAGTSMDERLNPRKAIPAAARLLSLKADRLDEIAFSRYGRPRGTDFWRFVLAAYNGGEGTIALAMGNAHRLGLSMARENGLVGNDALAFAQSFASRWDNLVAGGFRSPLATAVSRYFPNLSAAKYVEISDYPKAIIARTRHDDHAY